MPSVVATIPDQRRLRDAEQRLLDAVHDHARRPFAWGTADCCTWAFDAVQAVTGVDAIADLRGTYRTRWQALRVLWRVGGLRGLLDARLPGRVPDGGLLMHGDVGLVPGGLCVGGPMLVGALAVWWRGVWVAQGADGLVTLPADRLHPVRPYWRAGL